VIAGSRDIVDYNLVCDAIKESNFNITHVISGGCRGIDKLGERWAKENNVPCEVISADWDKWGKSAGLRRNREMAEIGDALIAITHGSRGTAHMIKMAQIFKLKIYIKEVKR